MSAADPLDRAFAPTSEADWVIVEDGRDPLRESNRETRFAMSNGFLGVRGVQAINRPPHPFAPPYTYVAGLFDVTDLDPDAPSLVPAPDWMQVRLGGAGATLSPHPADPSSHPLTLDLRRGSVLTRGRQLDASAVSMDLRMLRLVSLARRGIGLQFVRLEVEAGEADVTLEAWSGGATVELEVERRNQTLGVWRTRRSGKSLAMAVAASLTLGGQDLAPTATGPFRWTWTWRGRPGQVVYLLRLVAFARGDTDGSDPGDDAGAALEGARRLGWRGLVAEHEAAWADRWRVCDVAIDGDPDAQQALRFAAYHLNGAANPADERVSIGARGLTGEDYRGHVFWDTEIFLLPFYTLTWPEAARSLLMYRFHTLDAARAKAARMGWRGALYAWESADTGAETTPDQVIGPDRKVVDVLCGRQEQHISADVAYAVWQYYLATEDESFLLEAGAEILLETGRFWASRAEIGDDGRRHIRGVIGPDEYHEGVDDNAYTNVMARWNIRRALDVAALLAARWPARWASLGQTLHLDDAELAEWRAAADALVTGFDPTTGLYEQFAGFLGLEQIDLADYVGRSVPMDVVLGRERIGRAQVIKQADVVALLALLPEEFPVATAAANFAYYEPRCGQGSSLSRSMHGLAAARLGETTTALRYFRETAATDLADTHVAIGGGVHIAALGGLWQMAVLGFGGVSPRADGVGLDPRLPAGWRSLAFAFQWRGRHLKVRIDEAAGRVEVDLTSGGPMPVFIRGERRDLTSDHPRVVAVGDVERPAGAGAQVGRGDRLGEVKDGVSQTLKA